MTDTEARPGRLRIWLREIRAPFLVASAVPVIVGSAAGFSAGGEFHPWLAALALVGTVLLHAAANVANDFFDHRSGNDVANHNLTPFSGGSRVIDEGLLMPAQVIRGAGVLWAAGLGIGSGLAAYLDSGFLWALTWAGLLGGYFYSAPPVRLGYRGLGELTVAVLFGVLPVIGAFVVQTGSFEAWTLAPGAVLGLLVALVLFVNEFPDDEADRAAGKRTLVVLLGRERAARLSLMLLPATWIAAGLAAWLLPPMRAAGVPFVATAPLMVFTLRFAAVELPKPSGRHLANFLTLVLFVIGGLSLAAGFVISGLNR
jgi:1,4-dihydroxy-2-naphthoate octaprenyltransferase